MVKLRATHVTKVLWKTPEKCASSLPFKCALSLSMIPLPQQDFFIDHIIYYLCGYGEHECDRRDTDTQVHGYTRCGTWDVGHRTALGCTHLKALRCCYMVSRKWSRIALKHLWERYAGSRQLLGLLEAEDDQVGVSTDSSFSSFPHLSLLFKNPYSFGSQSH